MIYWIHLFLYIIDLGEKCLDFPGQQSHMWRLEHCGVTSRGRDHFVLTGEYVGPVLHYIPAGMEGSLESLKIPANSGSGSRWLIGIAKLAAALWAG